MQSRASFHNLFKLSKVRLQFQTTNKGPRIIISAQLNEFRLQIILVIKDGGTWTFNIWFDIYYSPYSFLRLLSLDRGFSAIMSRLHSFVFIFVILLDFTIAGHHSSSSHSSHSSSYPAQSYKLVKDYKAGTSSFFNNFNFYTGSDPTHGNVE